MDRNLTDVIAGLPADVQQELKQEEEGLHELRVSIRQGLAALDRGAFFDLEDEDLDAFLDELAAPDAP